jgi:hypothetical protein
VTLDNERTRTQNARIKNEWLLPGREIDALQALNYIGCFRLASRIHDLKKEGLDITDRRVKTPGGAVIKAYRLRTEEESGNATT